MKFGHIAIASLSLLFAVSQETYATNCDGEPNKLTTSPATTSAGEALEAAQPSAIVSKLEVDQILMIPKPLWIMIGNESRNTVNLKLACKFLNSLKYNTLRVLTFTRKYPETAQETADRISLALSSMGDDIQVLNLYQLKPNGDFGLFARIKIADQFKAFIDGLNKKGVREIKRIVLRADTIVPINLKDFLIENNFGPDILEFLPYAKGCDEVFNNVELDDRQIRLLIKLYRCNHPEDYHTSMRPLDLSGYIYRPHRPLSAPIPLDNRLVAMLDLYGQITATKNGKGLMQRVLIKHELRQRLHYLSDFPDLMAMIRYMCCSNLYTCSDIFNRAQGRYYDWEEPKNWASFFRAISHKDTIKMLALLRAFIPEYDESADFSDGVLTLLAIGTPVVTGRNDVGCISRKTLFVCFWTCLGHYDKDKQYTLLKRLLPIISLQKIGEEISSESEAVKEIIMALFYGFDILMDPPFSDLTDEEYDAFVVYFLEKHSDVNPLSRWEYAYAKLVTILEEFQRHKRESAANQ